MKISDVKTGREEADGPLPYPCSEIADPPIKRAETLAAKEAICCWHDGKIKTEPTPSDVYGRVYFCPIGRQYWRYSEQSGGLKLPPLKHRW